MCVCVCMNLAQSCLKKYNYNNNSVLMARSLVCESNFIVIKIEYNKVLQSNLSLCNRSVSSFSNQRHRGHTERDLRGEKGLGHAGRGREAHRVCAQPEFRHERDSAA